MAHDISGRGLLPAVRREVLVAIEGRRVHQPVHSSGEHNVERHLARERRDEPAVVGGSHAGANREPRRERVVAVGVTVFWDPHDPVPSADDAAGELELEALVVDDGGRI